MKVSNNTMKDVAKEANVSIATVSRVINNKGKVDPILKKNVNDAILKLNYQVNVIAKNLKEDRTKTIGVIIPDISNPHFMTISKGIEDITYQHGYQLIFGSSNENPQKENQLLNLFYGKRVESIVLATTGQNEETIQKIQELGTPILMVDRRVEIPGINLNTVEEDNIHGAYLLTKKLLEMGHTRIGVVNGAMSVSTGRDRFKGYQLAIKEAGIEEDSMLVYDGDFTKESGQRAVEYFYSTKAPSAIISFNNLMSIGVLKELFKRSIEVPKQMIVASYDVVEPEELVSQVYKILHIRSVPYAMGVKVGKILIEILSNGYQGKTYHEIFRSELDTYMIK